jgi:hypothetical protein
MRVGMQPPIGGEEPSGREGMTPGYGGVQSPPVAIVPPTDYVPAGYASPPLLAVSQLWAPPDRL